MSENRGAPGGAHNHGNPVSVDESIKQQLELKQALRRQGNLTLQREDERVKAAIEKARAVKEGRRAKNPYDFS